MSDQGNALEREAASYARSYDEMRAENERLRGLLKEAEEAIRNLAWRECHDCGGTGSLGSAADGRQVACESCYGSEDRRGDGWLPVGDNIEETMCSPAVLRALGEIGGEG